MSEGKVVQESIGGALVEALHAFAKNDIANIEDMQKNILSHLDDKVRRVAVAEVFYGARWLYKLGLVLLTDGPERQAHIRAQVLDYGSVCEAILKEMIWHGAKKNHFKGTKYQNSNLYYPGNKSVIDWTSANKEKTFKPTTFKWATEVALEEKVIGPDLYDSLEWLREARNSAHLHVTSQNSYMTTSKRAYETAIKCCRQTKRWKVTHV